MVLLVRELTHNLPSLTKIELYRNQIRLDDAKSARLATASSYLGFTLCEQSTSDTLSAVLPKHPQVINPLLARYRFPEFLRLRVELSGDSYLRSYTTMSWKPFSQSAFHAYTPFQGFCVWSSKIG